MTPRRWAPGGHLGGCLPSSSCLLCLSGPPSAPLFLKKFLMWAILSLYGISAILLLFYVLVFWPLGMWDLSSLTRDQIGTPRDGRQSLSPTGSPGTPLPPFLRAGTRDVVSRQGSRPATEALGRSVWSLLSCQTFSLFLSILRQLPGSVWAVATL